VHNLTSAEAQLLGVEKTRDPNFLWNWVRSRIVHFRLGEVIEKNIIDFPRWMHIHLYHTCPILTKTNLFLWATSRDIFFLFGFLAFSFTSPWFQFFGTAWGNSRVQNRSRNEQTLSNSLPRHSLREGLILAKAFLTGKFSQMIRAFLWIFVDFKEVSPRN